LLFRPGALDMKFYRKVCDYKGDWTMKNRALKSVLFILFATTLFGCKLRIEVPTGGHVEDSSGMLICDEREICIVDVVDIHFDETYTAVARPGYTFHGWKQRYRGLYGGVKKETVRLSTDNFADNEALLGILESNMEWYLEPDFAKNHRH
jgi:hypothetical protein